jgi:signal transduction histidine kinase
MRRIPIAFRWILAALFFVAFSWVVDHLGKSEPSRISKAGEIQFGQFLEIKSNFGKELIALLKDDQTKKDLEWFKQIKKFDDGHWEVICFKAGDPFRWTSPELDYDTSAVYQESNHFYYTRNKVYWVISEKVGDDLFLAAYPVQYNELGKTFHRFPRPDNLEVDISADSTNTRIQLSDTSVFLNVTEGHQGSVWGTLLALLAFLLVVRGIQFESWRQVPWYYFLLTLMMLFLFRKALYDQQIAVWLAGLEIMDPKIYASSFLLPSLGDLLLHALFAGVTLSLIFRIELPQNFRAGGAFKISALIMSVAAFFATDMVISLLKGLVLDSSISFDPSNIANINRYSLLASVAAGMTVYLLIRLISAIVLNYGSVFKTVWIPVLGLLVFIAFQILDGHRTAQSLLMPALSAILIALIYAGWRSKNGTSGMLIIVSVSAIFTTACYFYYGRLHEKEFLSFYANKLVTEKDVEAEYEFTRIENKLVSEFLVPEDFNSYITRKDQFEKRLRRLYFTGYLDKYDVRVFSFDSLGRSIGGASQYNYPYLSKLYDFNAMPTISDHFYHIKDPSVVNGYIARFDNCDLEGHNGSSFLVLQPKFIQIPHLFPRLLKKGKPLSGYDVSQYSYAIYVYGTLRHQKGGFAYPIQLRNGGAFDAKNNRLWNEDYKHFINRHSDIVTVVLSRSINYLNHVFSVFTLLFLFYLLIFFFWMFGIRLLNLIFKETDEEEVNKVSMIAIYAQNTVGAGMGMLSSRIRIALSGLLIAGLLVSVYLTSQYVRSNYNERMRENITSHLLEASNQLQNEVNLGVKLKNQDARQLLINQLSDLNKSVFHLYSTEGRLIATSEPQLFDQKIMGKLMNPMAFSVMNGEKVSKFQHKETLAGLDYQSAYVPLLDENRALLAYLNMSYFTEQEELNHEVSDFMMAYINLYFILFIAALALAWFISEKITRPLTMIREKISLMVLGSTNEMIDWKQNDEIGQLVRQYNKMVLELEESALKLSESEREGAWREMARQVAHEIKNPLTPMKLNIQHLQRAWYDKSDKLEHTFERVTKILVEQIDSLSNLASSFSDFAKMPNERFEVFDLRMVVSNAIHLFEKSSEVHFHAEMPEHSAEIRADKEQISRVFNNLFKNAIQAIVLEKIGRIEVKMHCVDGRIITEVCDNGSGIADTLKDKIFVPNFSTKTSGMGLGLAISRKIVEVSGGSIRFESHESKGTCFIVDLPEWKS